MSGYRLIRSARGTLSLEVTIAQEVIVRAPKAMPKATIDAFVRSRGQWIEEHIRRQKLRAQSLPPEPSEEEGRALRALALRELPARVDRFARRMGVRPTGLRVTGAKTRFGSCSARNALCFSWRLMGYPESCWDAVVVHELAHIVHKNHGAGFYGLVCSVLPDYRERERLLKGPRS